MTPLMAPDAQTIGTAELGLVRICPVAAANPQKR